MPGQNNVDLSTSATVNKTLFAYVMTPVVERYGSYHGTFSSLHSKK